MAIEKERVKRLSGRPPGAGGWVMYWMQQSQRARFNHALEYAVERANELGRPVMVAFGLTADYPEANLRHYQFMLEGLRETAQELAERGIPMVVRIGDPAEVALELARHAALIVCDRGYLRHQKAWRAKVAREASVEVIQVESDVVVPVEMASRKAEYAARTIRPKLQRHLERFLTPLRTVRVKLPAKEAPEDGESLRDLNGLVERLKLDRSVEPSRLFTGGTAAGQRTFKDFLRNRLEKYVVNRNRPETDDVSHIAMYLHFGQISPVWAALEVRKVDAPVEAREAFLEQLIVRRELGQNFVNFTPDYDRYSCLPAWARATLRRHKKDKRPVRYTRAQLENSQTHDPYWNAAMREMRVTGYMHNYLRMYWGKKILEWSGTPEYAWRTALYLNNKYFLDGRDPNAYANVGWVFGLHDRPWAEREIFGTVRWMSASGLERKSDPKAYVEKVERMSAEA